MVLDSTLPCTERRLDFLRSFHADESGVRICFEGQGSNAAARFIRATLQSSGHIHEAREGAFNTLQSSTTRPPVEQIRLSFFGLT